MIFSSVKEKLSLLVEQELNKVREELIANNKPNIKKNNIKFLSLDEINLLNNAYEVDYKILKVLFQEPHFKYIHNFKEDGPGYGCTMIHVWLGDSLDKGVVAAVFSEEDVFNSDNSYFNDVMIESFKVHKVGKTGRTVKCGEITHNKLFFEHYDNFIADIILLGLDEPIDTLTESKD